MADTPLVMRLLHEIQALLQGQHAIMKHLLKIEEIQMATQAQLDDLVAKVDAAKTAVDTGVTNIRADIEALKAAAPPELDFTTLEASVDALVASSASVTALDEENPATPVDPTV